MRLKDLYDIQRTLNERILKEHKLDKDSLRSKKFLALFTELGELANETRVFKYWSNKGPSPREVILEEYVDCLHFVLTLGIDHGFEDSSPSLKTSGKEDLTEQFVRVFSCADRLLEKKSEENYMTLLEEFLYLGKLLDFDEDTIEKAYLEKNRINHVRQDTHY